MTEVTLTLPDDPACQAREAGLLRPEALAEMLDIAQQTMAHYAAGKVHFAAATLPVLAAMLHLGNEELIATKSRTNRDGPAKKPGPAPIIERQLEHLNALPQGKQRVIVQVLDSMLAQASR